MRIIERGKPSLQSFTVRCRNCHCKFEFLDIEARRVSDKRDGDYFVIKCPDCKSEVTKQA